MHIPAYAAAPIVNILHVDSYVGIPVFRSDGKLFGTMCAIDTKPADGIEQHQSLVDFVSQMLGFAVDRQRDADVAARRADRAEDEASSDGLTGLANRRGWDRLMNLEQDRCRRYGYPACVFVVDLDGFKEINDTLGHATGDRVLQGVARCLQSSFRSSDILARTGGDEFSILAVDCDAAEGRILEKRINDTLANESIAASVGLSYRPAARLVDVWKAADDAMYVVKRARRGEALALVS